MKVQLRIMKGGLCCCSPGFHLLGLPSAVEGTVASCYENASSAALLHFSHPESSAKQHFAA